MHRMIRLSLLTLAAATLSGCLGGRPVKYFTVAIPSSAQPADHAFPVALLIGSISAPEILQNQPIVYRSGRYEIGAYQYHLWTEPPAQLVKMVLMRRLRGSGKYQSVARLGGSTQGNFLLRGRLYNFEEVDSGGAIAAKVSMEFELVDRRIHKSVWTHFYSRTEPVQGRKITDVVSALDHNLEQGINEVESGLDSYFSSHLSVSP